MVKRTQIRSDVCVLASRFRNAILTALAAVVVAASLAGCGSDKSKSARTTTLTVYAASSLTGTFTELGSKFEAAHAGVKVSFSFGGSSDLVTQIEQGAPADVFASADAGNMDKLTAEHLDGRTPKNFASNTLEIVTPPDNPAHISSFADLAKKGVDLVICAAEVPCGSAAQAVASNAGINLAPVSEEESVKDVLAKVTSGEADAGLVYVTDVKAAGATVKGITFPEASTAVNTYPITTVKGSKNLTLATEFVELVLSSTGQTVLADAGFAQP
ncbi:MAG: molybdate-binding protein [Marmoricola sp.]|nr:molybdate-binding protein [Marmoricola sp.]